MNWKTSKKDFEWITKIADRSEEIAVRHEVPWHYRTALMDVTAVHANGCPLRLEELYNAPEFDFTHDIFGIARHINRDTGKLENCFVPRYAAGVKAR